MFQVWVVITSGDVEIRRAGGREYPDLKSAGIAEFWMIEELFSSELAEHIKSMDKRDTENSALDVGIQ